jgi:hypothetical protein
MGGLFVLGFGAAFGVAGYRSLPPTVTPAWPLFLLAIVAVSIAAYLAGKSRVQSQWQLQIQTQEQDQKQAQQQSVQVFVGHELGAGGVAAQRSALALSDHHSAADHATSSGGSGKDALPSTDPEYVPSFLERITWGERSDPATALVVRSPKQRVAVFPPDP